MLTKPIKKYMLVLLCFLVISLFYKVKAEEIDENKKDIIYTDIVAYIDDKPIQSFNIEGKTFIFVEDLNKYGFDVKWVEENQYLSIEYNPTKQITAKYIPEIDKSKIGEIIGIATNKDMTVCIERQSIGNKCSIRGKTAILLDTLAQYYAKDYTWSQDERTLKLTLSKEKAKTFDWSSNIDWRDSYSNSDYIKDTSSDNISICSLNKVLTEDGYKIQLESVTGKKQNAFDFAIHSNGLLVSFYQNNFNEVSEIMSALSKCVNIEYSKRIIENTQERKDEVSKTFRVFVNDKQIDGEFNYFSGNGHCDYVFTFDKKIPLEDIQTICIESEIQ